ncbi:hypothetical protein [Candidatus Symbiopectobacterium sp.]|uniref:hypothetical protein n=1 Tax=Candidatus Symbiopectobacterium sp. TaxID=2816440 RepID=UPI0025BAF85D|nr:hypothetical protein [Candidatus Symbiopectobacterium sp.]
MEKQHDYLLFNKANTRPKSATCKANSLWITLCIERENQNDADVISKSDSHIMDFFQQDKKKVLGKYQ